QCAANEGETLAMSNIAREFIAAGFLKEAYEQCQKALSIPDYNAAIGHDLARIKEIPDEENEKLEGLLNGSSEKRGFYREMGAAIAQVTIHDLPTFWSGPDGPTKIEVTGDAFVAQCAYEISGGFLSTALGGTGRICYLRRWEGRIVGRAIFATVTRDQIDPPAQPKTILSVEDKSKVLLFVTDDGTEIQAIEAPQAKSPRFYTFTLPKPN